MKTGQILEWAICDSTGSFAFRKPRKEARAFLRRLDPTGRLGFRIAKVQVVK